MLNYKILKTEALDNLICNGFRRQIRVINFQMNFGIVKISIRIHRVLIFHTQNVLMRPLKVTFSRLVRESKFGFISIQPSGKGSKELDETNFCSVGTKECRE